MLRKRVIPCLLLKGEGLVKTVRFKSPGYLGDPINTVRIFNELEVDELCFLDIDASKNGSSPDYKILKEIADECFMPLSYGGGITSLETAKKIFSIGFEKVVLNTAALNQPALITEISRTYGAQSIIVSIDVKKSFLGKLEVYARSGTEKHRTSLIEWAKKVEDLGAGEILLTSIDREGTWKGFDIDMVQSVSSAVNIPVIANGGAGNVSHIAEVFQNTNASAVALGSMVVYQAQGLGVLINFPDRNTLDPLLVNNP